MTPDEADQLAIRICATWPDMRIPADAWTDAITELDAGTLGTAFARARATLTKPPTIAEMLGIYHRLSTATTNPLRQTGPVMSFAAYLATIARRSAAGDLEAAEMLEVWERNLANRTTPQLQEAG